jgi:predicted amidohydrolase
VTDRGAIAIREDGSYETVPLRADSVAIGIVQTKAIGIDGENPAPGLRSNLDYLLACIDKAQGHGGRCDLLCFHEFPLQGFRPGWDRAASLRVAIEVPGPEVAEIGARAKKYNCYVAFGCLARDAAWPGHVFNWQVLVGPAGQIVDVHWKQRNVRGMFPGAEQFTTTVYDVLDEYVERYGIDRVVPVARTDIGNIAMSSVQFEPELFRCMALKGAEIICRVATGGCEWQDMRLTSYHNSVYTTLVNNCLNLGTSSPDFFEETASKNDWVGHSAIFGPRGEVLAEADKFETRRRAVVDMKSFRARHRLPDVHVALYRHVYDAYRERYDPGLYSRALPATKLEAFRHFQENARWIHYW